MGRWHWILAGLLLLRSTFALGEPAEYRNSQVLVETAELATIISKPDVRLLDARSPEEYRLRHLPGAANLPARALNDLEANRHGDPLPTDWAQRLFRTAGINSSSRVVVYDDQGNRFAARVFFVLEFFGHPRVQVLNGGIRKWQSEGRPTTTEEPKHGDGDFKPVPNPALMATSQWVKQHLKLSDVVLVDARSPAEFHGEGVPDPRAGHIPGAANIEWTHLLDPGEIKTLLPADKLGRVFAESKVTPNREVVAYCETGMRAALTYFALRLLGYPRVRLYDGSWEEWGSDPTLPVEK